MDLYQTMYHGLFNALTDAIHAMEAQNYGQALTILKQAQCDAEERYLQADE